MEKKYIFDKNDLKTPNNKILRGRYKNNRIKPK